MKTIHEVLFDGAADGPAADGTHVARFRKLTDAERFAAKSTCYGRQATVQTSEVSAKLFSRWNSEGQVR